MPFLNTMYKLSVYECKTVSPLIIGDRLQVILSTYAQKSTTLP